MYKFVQRSTKYPTLLKEKNAQNYTEFTTTNVQ